MLVIFSSAGSIGSRHIKNLSELCKNKKIPLEIHAIRKSNRVLPREINELVSKEIRDDSDLSKHYDIGFVTDETKNHYDSIIKLKHICDNLFIEKPIFDKPAYDFDTILPVPKNSIYYVACPIRFSEYYKQLKKHVESNDIFSARIIFSSYMPNWQKGRDYRKSFRCFEDKGGGVDIDSLHEIDYMTALFGKPKEIFRSAKQVSNLEMDACDLATYIFNYDDKIVEMHLDYFGRANNRRVELFSKDDVIIIDFNKKKVIKQRANQEEFFGPDDQFYQREMEYFINLVMSGDNTANINPIENAFASLEISKGIC